MVIERCTHRDSLGNMTLEYDSPVEMRSSDMYCKVCGESGSRQELEIQSIIRKEIMNIFSVKNNSQCQHKDTDGNWTISAHISDGNDNVILHQCRLCGAIVSQEDLPEIQEIENSKGSTDIENLTNSEDIKEEPSNYSDADEFELASIEYIVTSEIPEILKAAVKLSKELMVKNNRTKAESDLVNIIAKMGASLIESALNNMIQ